MSDAAELPILNRDDFLNRMGGDARIVKKIATVFLGECPNYLGRIKAAAKARDWPLLKREAHSLKGGAANVGGERLKAAALALEGAAKAEKEGAVPGLIEGIEREMTVLVPEPLQASMR